MVRTILQFWYEIYEFVNIFLNLRYFLRRLYLGQTLKTILTKLGQHFSIDSSINNSLQKLRILSGLQMSPYFGQTEPQTGHNINLIILPIQIIQI